MKVKIGNYPTWVGPYQIAEKLLFWMDKYEDERVHKLGTFLAGESNDTWLAKVCQWIHDKRKRTISIKLDEFDSWNAHNTASLILHPLLKQLQDTKHGSGYVDDADAPEHLRSTAPGAWDGITDDERTNCYYSDNYLHKRYEWMLSEVIWALEQDNADWEEQYTSGKAEFIWEDVPDKPGYKEMKHGTNHTYNVDWAARQAHQERISNGFRLMGKYWQSFWD